MGILSKLFGKPKLVDKVPPPIRVNTECVSKHMETLHPKIEKIGDFTFEYLYTSPEPITQNGDYGSVIYIRIGSDVHENVPQLENDFSPIQQSIDAHYAKYGKLPTNVSKDVTRFLYFNMGKVFRTI